jgi:hypothetical protein
LLQESINYLSLKRRKRGNYIIFNISRSCRCNFEKIPLPLFE